MLATVRWSCPLSCSAGVPPDTPQAGSADGCHLAAPSHLPTWIVSNGKDQTILVFKINQMTTTAGHRIYCSKLIIYFMLDFFPWWRPPSGLTSARPMFCTSFLFTALQKKKPLSFLSCPPLPFSYLEKPPPYLHPSIGFLLALLASQIIKGNPPTHHTLEKCYRQRGLPIQNRHIWWCPWKFWASFVEGVLSKRECGRVKWSWAELIGSSQRAGSQEWWDWMLL